MRRTAIFLTLISCAGILLAASAWEKDFSQWTSDDAKRILRDSPWSKQAVLRGQAAPNAPGADSGGAPASIPPSSGPSRAPATASQGQPGGMGPSGGGSAAPGGGPGMGEPGGGGTAEAPQRTVLIQWLSATPVRLAELKQKAGNGQPSQADIQQATQPATSYEVAVIGVPGSPQPNEDKQLAGAATLNRKGKPPIQASDVKEQPLTGGQGRVLIFSFPKTDPISATDKSVEFRLARGPLPEEIRKDFKLKDMQYNGKVDL